MPTRPFCWFISKATRAVLLFLLSPYLFSPGYSLFFGYAMAEEVGVIGLPTPVPIPNVVMNGGKGVNFSAENYQLITPELRKSKNDWLNSIYVQYKPESDKGELYFPTTILTVSQFLTKLSEQTGRRFAFQKGLEQQVSIGAEDEKWIAVLERFIEASKLELENVGDILVVSAPPPVIIEEKTDLKGIGFTMVLIAMVLGITVWFVFRPKKRVDPRGGWR